MLRGDVEKTCLRQASRRHWVLLCIYNKKMVTALFPPEEGAGWLLFIHVRQRCHLMGVD